MLLFLFIYLLYLMSYLIHTEYAINKEWIKNNSKKGKFLK